MLNITDINGYQSGVTFLELIITVAIIGILAAIAVPYYGDYIERQRLVGAAEAVYGQMQLAKRLAISNNATVYFVVSGANSSNWCVTYSELNATSSDCNDGWVVSTSNPSVRVLSESYPTVTLSGPSSNFSIGFSMPGLVTVSAGQVSLSTGSSILGDLAVGAGPGLQLSVCSTGSLGQYADC